MDYEEFKTTVTVYDFRAKKCCNTHFQILSLDEKPLVDFWPTTGKFRQCNSKGEARTGTLREAMKAANEAENVIQQVAASGLVRPTQDRGPVKDRTPQSGFTVGDTIRMPNWETAGGFRVWKIVSCHLGAEKQEGTWGLIPLDWKDNKTIEVPCIMLETHPSIERV